MTEAYVARRTETYGSPEHGDRRIVGNVACVALSDCNVLVVSLGRPKAECDALADRLARFLKGEPDGRP